MEINFDNIEDWTDPLEWENKMSALPGQKWSFEIINNPYSLPFEEQEMLVIAYELFYKNILLN